VKAPEGAYVTRADEVVLLPGAAEAVRRLNDAGVRVVLASNQRGVARGLMTAADLRTVQSRLAELLSPAGAVLDAAYFCLHGAGSCGCRKPLPGLLLRAAAENPSIELSRSVMVGDAESDVAAGSRAGAETVRIAPPGMPSEAGVVVPDLAAAVDWILSPARLPAAGDC
jgi:D-glycero-D-manno-heptose 1,7-bisphosphate phosphatase